MTAMGIRIDVVGMLIHESGAFYLRGNLGGL
jgi:hypothetical protein